MSLRNAKEYRSKQFQTRIWRNYNFFKFLPQLYTYSEVFQAILFLLILWVFYFGIFNVFFYFLYSFAKMKVNTVCARGQGSIFMVFWPFSPKKIAKLLKKSERWTMIQRVVKSKFTRGANKKSERTFETPCRTAYCIGRNRKVKCKTAFKRD